MLNNFIILFFYLFLITFSVIGYGIIFNKILYPRAIIKNFGFLGIQGIFVLTFYAYLSHLFIAHSLLHNLIIFLIGLFVFIKTIFKKFKNYKKKITETFIIFLLLSASFIIYKNHDDFSYYHFQYTYYLTQNNFSIGIGQFNHGFRTPSSIFYVNSLFYLPYIKYYSFNIYYFLTLIYANLVLLNYIFKNFLTKNLKKNKINYLNYLSLLSFLFINIFFYRISEHGTDRSAQIFILILIITFLSLENLKKIKLNDLKNFFVIISIIISIKAFYILYLILALPLIYLIFSKKKSLLKSIYFLVFNRFFFVFFLIFILIILNNFINTGCLLYPVTLTCFEKFSWSIPIKEVVLMNNWYELWSKAGANPNFRIDNPNIYINEFNWVGNWFKMYFFNKVSDFLLGLSIIIFIILFIFREKKGKKIFFLKSFNFTYFILLILFFEWFYNHPALRYGGYCLIVLLIFIPLSKVLEIKKVSYKKYFISSIILIILTFFIFNVRNISRIIKEVDKYDYKPFSISFYNIDSNYFKFQKNLLDIRENYTYCINKHSKCDNNKKQIKIIFGKVIYLNK